MKLHELIVVRRAEIVERWRKSAREAVAGESLPPRVLIDTLPMFLDELATALEAADRTGREDRALTDRVAAMHGGERLHLGFAPHEMVREYGILRDCIFALAEEDRVAPSLAEMRALSGCLIDAIGAAIATYVRERDAQQLQQATEHLAFLAHELRNPLSAARTSLELARRENHALPERLSHLLGVTRRGLDQAFHELDHALTQARMRVRPTNDLERVNVGDLLREAAAEASALADTQGVEIRVEAGEHTPHVDRRLIRSAVTNLVHNAVKFSRTGGQVVLRAREVGGLVRLEVEDECGGLPPGAAEKLFDPFVQVGPNRSGFGLGLAIARQAVDAHGGNLSVHDLPGKGCVFLLELPDEPTN